MRVMISLQFLPDTQKLLSMPDLKLIYMLSGTPIAGQAGSTPALRHLYFEVLFSSAGHNDIRPIGLKTLTPMS